MADDCLDDPVTTHAVLVAIGAAQHLPHDLALDLPPLSPAGQGAVQLALTVDDDRILNADVRIGLLHRSAEKLFEARDYRQLLMLANRHEWLSAFTSELGVALTLEDAMGITPPERATWARTLLVEFTRITASLALIGPLTAPTALEIRERLITLQEIATGGRLHPMFVRIGGIAEPLQPQWLDDLHAVLSDLSAALPGIAAAVDETLDGYAGVGVLTTDDAIACAATGPVGRASGVNVDLRRDAPSLCYAALAEHIRVPISTDGDVPARYRMLLEQLPVSIDLITACAEQLRALGDGPVNIALPKVVRVPEGTSYGQIESSLGIAGTLLVSVGEKTPWRLKLRTPSFANLQALERALPGTRMDQLAMVVPSFMYVIGDADR